MTIALSMEEVDALLEGGDNTDIEEDGQLTEESLFDVNLKIDSLFGFLKSVETTHSVSPSTFSFLNTLIGSTSIPTLEDYQDMTFDPQAVVFMAVEDLASSIGKYSGKLGVMLGVPLVTLALLDKKLTRATRDTISFTGKKLGLLKGNAKISKETASMIVRSVEAALGIGVLYFTGLGGAMARAAQTPSYAKTFVGQFVEKISRFKWPFGSVKAGWQSSKRAVVEFVWDVEDAVINDQAAKAGWESVDAMTFMTKAQRMLSVGIKRLYDAVKSGISGFTKSVSGVVLQPITKYADALGNNVAVRTDSLATGQLAAGGMKLLGGFALVTLGTFVLTVVRKSISALVSLFTTLISEAKRAVKALKS